MSLELICQRPVRLSPHFGERSLKVVMSSRDLGNRVPYSYNLKYITCKGILGQIVLIGYIVI